MAGILNIQIKPFSGNKTANINLIEHFIKKNQDKKLDLVVFPEFFSTGIDHESFTQAPENEQGGDTIQKICEIAKKYNTNIIAGTVIEKADNKLYNTMFVIDREGKIITKYRKIHLYNYLGGNEGGCITPGDEIVTVDLDFAKIGLSICFDIRYPLHYKQLAKSGAEIIVQPACWIVPNEIYENKDSKNFAQDTWVALNKIRAFDNLVYIVSSNQTGKINDNVSAIGNSLIISPTTEILANAKDEQCAIYADIDLDIVKYYKTIYPIASID